MAEKLELVDYGGGNIGSITRCLERLKAQYRLVGSGDDLTGGSPIVFPGVGSFGACLERLARSGLDTALHEAVKSGTPLLSICVGLQVLMERSAESPGICYLRRCRRWLAPRGAERASRLPRHHVLGRSPSRSPLRCELSSRDLPAPKPQCNQ
ncbi:MAG: hypothetical protein CEE38_23505 [Planctomycetes bacterium B3_Pla]|nr:MAG: hypothetical protein CEE38_23505 [Planctomycetes bacterium B3_Pla]